MSNKFTNNIIMFLYTSKKHYQNQSRSDGEICAIQLRNRASFYGAWDSPLLSRNTRATLLTVESSCEPVFSISAFSSSISLEKKTKPFFIFLNIKLKNYYYLTNCMKPYWTLQIKIEFNIIDLRTSSFLWSWLMTTIYQIIRMYINVILKH